MGRKASCRAKDCARAQCVKTHHQPASKLDLAARQRGEDLLELIGMKCVDIVEDRDGLQEEWRAHPVDLDLLYALKRLVRFDRFAWQIFNPWWQQARAYRRSEEHTSELQSLMRISYAVFCLKKQK